MAESSFAIPVAMCPFGSIFSANRWEDRRGRCNAPNSVIVIPPEVVGIVVAALVIALLILLFVFAFALTLVLGNAKSHQQTDLKQGNQELSPNSCLTIPFDEDC